MKLESYLLEECVGPLPPNPCVGLGGPERRDALAVRKLRTCDSDQLVRARYLGDRDSTLRVFWSHLLELCTRMVLAVRLRLRDESLRRRRHLVLAVAFVFLVARVRLIVDKEIASLPRVQLWRLRAGASLSPRKFDDVVVLDDGGVIVDDGIRVVRREVTRLETSARTRALWRDDEVFCEFRFRPSTASFRSL